MSGRVLLALVVLFAALGALAACGDRKAVGSGADAKDVGSPPEDALVDEEAQPAPRPRRDDDWKRHIPRISLLLVANQRGKLKPCGCSEPQLGGLERLAKLVELVRGRFPPDARADRIGALSMGWSLSGRGEDQDEAKAALYRAALELLKFDAMVLGTTDLHVPALSQPFLGGAPADQPRPPANLPLSNSSDLDDPWAYKGPLAMSCDVERFARFEVNGLEVRAFGIVDPGEGHRVGDVSPVVLGPAAALQGITPRSQTLWIASTDATGETIDKLETAVARLGPGIILDLSGSAGVDLVEGATLDEPLVVTLANLGKEVGVLDLDPLPPVEGAPEDAPARWRVSYHVVELEPELEEVPSTLRGEVGRLFDAYRRQVRERGYLASFGTYPREDEIRYVGSSRCAACHPGIYQDWVRTSHATALPTLEARDYHWDPECVRCHVVGFERFPDGRWGRVEGGFTTPDETPHLGGVGCECCHGPGEAHVESPRDRSLWSEGGPNVRHPGKRGCMVCHDVENSFGFDEHYETDFLPRVDHRGVPSDRRVVYEEGD